MKKLLAVIMSVVMAFSIAVIPASAAEEVTIDEFFDAIETSMALIEDTIAQIHNIVGSILGVLGKECPMCAEIHEIPTEEDAETEVEIPEISTEEDEAEVTEAPEAE